MHTWHGPMGERGNHRAADTDRPIAESSRSKNCFFFQILLFQDWSTDCCEYNRTTVGRQVKPRASAETPTGSLTAAGCYACCGKYKATTGELTRTVVVLVRGACVCGGTAQVGVCLGVYIRPPLHIHGAVPDTCALETTVHSYVARLGQTTDTFVLIPRKYVNSSAESGFVRSSPLPRTGASKNRTTVARWLFFERGRRHLTLLVFRFEASTPPHGHTPPELELPLKMLDNFNPPFAGRCQATSDGSPHRESEGLIAASSATAEYDTRGHPFPSIQVSPMLRSGPWSASTEKHP